MYGIFTYIGVVWGVNVGIYGIHGVSGYTRSVWVVFSGAAVPLTRRPYCGGSLQARPSKPWSSLNGGAGALDLAAPWALASSCLARLLFMRTGGSPERRYDLISQS